MLAACHPTRRDWLRHTAAALATGCGTGAPLGAATPAFALGVASGWPSAHGVTLWTRLTDTPDAPDDATVDWVLADNPSLEPVLRHGRATAAAALAHSVHVSVDDLPADRWWYYRFAHAGQTSPVGRTRTLPAPGQPARALRIAWASCQRWDLGYFSAYDALRADAPDLVVFVGDSIYEYPRSRDAVRDGSRGWTLSLDDYRTRHALYLSDPALQAMRAACPWVLTWDDHEVQNDYAGLHPGQGGPPVASFAARRAGAYQAYFEHMPLPDAVLTQGVDGLRSGAELRLYQRLELGALGSLHVLDTRQYRDRQVCTPKDQPGGGLVDVATCPAWADAQRTLLGAAQQRWLAASLRQPSAGWNLLAQTTWMGPREFRHPQQPLRRNDTWDGYPAARLRLLQALARVPNPVVLGGDIHEFWVGQLPRDPDRPDGPALAAEFCVGGITAHGGGNAKLAQRLARNPHVLWADADHNGYGLIDLTPQALTVQLRAVQDVRQPNSATFTLARFGVQAGSPRISRLD